VIICALLRDGHHQMPNRSSAHTVSMLAETNLTTLFSQSLFVPEFANCSSRISVSSGMVHSALVCCIGEIGGVYSISEMWNRQGFPVSESDLQDRTPPRTRRPRVASYIPIPVFIPPSPNVHSRCILTWTQYPALAVVLMRGWSCNVSYRHSADWGWGSTTSPTELHWPNAPRLGPKSIDPLGITTLIHAEIIMSKNRHLTLLTLSGL
jgi:hypothetical protein